MLLGRCWEVCLEVGVCVRTTSCVHVREPQLPSSSVWSRIKIFLYFDTNRMRMEFLNHLEEWLDQAVDRANSVVAAKVWTLNRTVLKIFKKKCYSSQVSSIDGVCACGAGDNVFESHQYYCSCEIVCAWNFLGLLKKLSANWLVETYTKLGEPILARMVLMWAD